LAELVERLQAAVGNSYRIEKELGGGGMSRVFLAEEVELARRVVIKVLPPEMGAEVNKERFHREIQLAARLQHPLVVPLLTAGSEDDILYYVMPYIEGESLRAKLAREGELPIGEAVRMLKDVMEALAYAHKSGVVHRDIKPDNVLLTEGHAVVADFGVAKAVTASSGASSLTSLGVALGTPAYMAPEQAAADPHTDHRADIYAVGALAYEMLCGRPPFTAPTPQAVMAAHVSEIPEPVTKHRSAASEALNALVMRCLEKKAADRWQSAADLVPQLEGMTTPSGGVTPTGTQPVAAVSAEQAAQQAHPVRVAGLFGLASIGVLAVVYLLVQAIGLPDWVFVGAIGLLAAGLPIMVLTGHHERQRAIARTTGMQVMAPAQGVQRWFTWRKAITGGGVAFAGLAILATVYTTMRLLGIGPVGTLVASGVLDEQDRLILADFANRTSDSTLGPSITEALRVDLAQSPVVNLVDISAIRSVLQRMNRNPDTQLDASLAREIAQREGIKAAVTGEIGPLGSRYVLTANLVSSETGEVLIALRETADDEGEIVDAVDELSAGLRERIGESLRTIRASEPLQQVTTRSLEALRLYSQALRAMSAGRTPRGIEFLEEAVAVDSTFAMAWRGLAIGIWNTGGDAARRIEAASKAFEYRDRLPERERYLTTAVFYEDVEFDLNRSAAAYRTLLESRPDDWTALNNLALVVGRQRRFAEAESLASRAAETGKTWQGHGNTAAFRLAQGRYDEAEKIIEDYAILAPEHPRVKTGRALLASARRDFATSETHTHDLLQTHTDPFWQGAGNVALMRLYQVQGRLDDAERHARAAMDAHAQRRLPRAYLNRAVDIGLLHLLYRDSPAEAVSGIDVALARYPLDSISPFDRPYISLAYLFAKVGQVERARDFLAEFETEVNPGVRAGIAWRHGAYGALALAEGRAEDAIAEYRAWYDETDCASCGLFELAQAYEAAGATDSALAVYERAVSQPGLYRLSDEYAWLGSTYKRLGELYEERGERDKAVDYYGRFVELWGDADSELQPLVEDVRGRIAGLMSER
jgi:tetratricopeptide (TPR) repeat protein